MHVPPLDTCCLRNTRYGNRLDQYKTDLIHNSIHLLFEKSHARRKIESDISDIS
jgi:hypothetical protein